MTDVGGIFENALGHSARRVISNRPSVCQCESYCDDERAFISRDCMFVKE